MKTFRNLASMLGLALFWLNTGVAQAGPVAFEFDINNSSVDITNTAGFCNGCTVTTTLKNPTPNPFELSDIGDAFEFDFFDINIMGGGLISGASADVEATIAFIAPSIGSSTGTGSGNYAAIGIPTYFGTFTIGAGGSLTWAEQPGNIVFADGSEVSLGFSDVAFASGDAGCLFFSSGGCSDGVTLNVAANTTLQAIPEPGVLALFGAGLFAVGAVSRRRKISSDK